MEKERCASPLRPACTVAGDGATICRCAGLESTEGWVWGGGVVEVGEEEEEKRRRRKNEEEEAKDEARRWVSTARWKEEREDGGEALQRRGGTGEDAHRSVRASAQLCRLTRIRSAPLWWQTGTCLTLFIYSFIYLFIHLLVCLRDAHSPRLDLLVPWLSNRHEHFFV